MDLKTFRPSFKRVAIVNRGEPSVRLLHAVHELNEQYDWQLQTIALYTTADQNSLGVRESDLAVCIGEATFVDAQGNRKSSYLDYDRLRTALTKSEAEAVWVGWGFVSEHAEFADLCADLGITFIGPTGNTMRRLGDKIGAKRLAEEARVPVAPWSRAAVETIDDAQRHAHEIGFPLVIKATAGGGGRGIRKVMSPDQLTDAFTRARSEAGKAFGDDRVFIEKMVDAARHIEVQILADHHGTCWAVGVRDCTMQRKHQKIIEEAPSPILTPEQEHELRDAATRLALAADYHNAGTVEYLFDNQGRTYFMEMNTRLQVEHPVTEVTTGLDLVKLQLYIAGGGRLEGSPPRTVGHAIEVRLNAEDPEKDYAPAPGLLEVFRLPSGPGLRVDTGFAEGDEIPSEFDSMIAKIIAVGQTRDEALARLIRGLAECTVSIKGGISNKAFLLELLKSKAFRQSEFDIAWLDRNTFHNEGRYRPHADAAIVYAALEVYEAEAAAERAQYFSSTALGRPKVRPEVGLPMELGYLNQTYKLTVYRSGGDTFQVEVEGERIRVQCIRQTKFFSWLTMAGQRHRVVSHPQGMDFIVEVDGMAYRISRDEAGVIRSPGPALVLSIAVEVGQTVAVGQRIMVLEAMKMEMPVIAPAAGRIREILVSPNLQVAAGAPLMLIEPKIDDAENRPIGTRVSFRSEWRTRRLTPIASIPSDDYESILRNRVCRNLAAIKPYLLGYEVTRADISGLVRELENIGRPSDIDQQIIEQEDELISICVDILSLYNKPRLESEREDEGTAQHDHLLQYLRDLDGAGDGLPVVFVDHLKRLLRHYGIFDLKHTVQLEDALVWIHKAHTRLRGVMPGITSMLAGRLRFLQESPTSTAYSTEPFRDLLDRLIDATQEEWLELHELAQQLRFRCFHQPYFDELRTNVHRQLIAEIQRYTPQYNETERTRLLQLIADCPLPLTGMLTAELSRGADHVRELLLQALLLRYYRIRSLRNVRVLTIDGLMFAVASFIFQRQSTTVALAFSTLENVEVSLRHAKKLLTALGDVQGVILDFFLASTQHKSNSDELAVHLKRSLEQANFSTVVRRIGIGLVNLATEEEIDFFTFTAEEVAIEEVVQYRGIHPMWAGRLELWRLRNFTTERIPAAPDIHLIRAVARDNPQDDRLFAILDIRDLTPIRAARDGVLQLPHFERMFAEALASMRDYLFRLPPHQRPIWNRIIAVCWSPFVFPTDELGALINRLAPGTKNLGLEKVVIRALMPDRHSQNLTDRTIHCSIAGEKLVRMRIGTPSQFPIRSLTPYMQKVVKAQSRGVTYAYEIIRRLTPETEGTSVLFPAGAFKEFDFDDSGKFIPVERPYGNNVAGVIVGQIRNFTHKYPEGISRIVILGDATHEMCALAEPECRRVIAAIDLAEQQRIPIEWYAISSGAKISVESGTENLDWTARVLRRLIEFTQRGGEVNVILDGINVGAQSYWNAEATMLMHTRGVLIMTRRAAMILTGKRALDYSGSVSAEDNIGIGGADRIMGPNGEAQYIVSDLTTACSILFQHYDCTYVAPGERFPRRAQTRDLKDRDVTNYPHRSSSGQSDFATVGDIFSAEKNRARKKPFDIRSVMRSVTDVDHPYLERWTAMRGAETAVVWHAHIGGIPVMLLGIESTTQRRPGFVPPDGPDVWAAGTLFPQSSKKVARAINSASGRLPLVILANLSGFDGSPESLRKRQLEYGAEIGRAVVNFSGPIVFCVVSRYHGGAYVVFSQALNSQLEAAAIEGSYASVIGGAPAAAVVLTREVKARTFADPRIKELQQQIANADEREKSRLRSQLSTLVQVIQIEKQTQVAQEFDAIHNIQRAKDMGSLHHVLTPARLRPYLIEAIERGQNR